ncbi:MAG: nucleoside triphosphate pyrophosphatase [Steroidobacteraceae bacterium]
MFLKSPLVLILASTSAYRRQLLLRLKIPFECASPGVDETPHLDEAAASLVARLALAKAQAVAVGNPDAWVIGSDQAAVVRDDAGRETILGKPRTADRCIDQLQRSSGRTVSFLTAVAVVKSADSAIETFTDTTRVTFRTLDRSAIERYVEREAPLDCAGGFKSEGLGISLCASIESVDPTALIGLPLLALCQVLRSAGFPLP